MASAPPTESVLPADWAKPGRVIAGRFRVERVLGQGGMGVVVEAFHLQLGERVALKFLAPDRAERRGAAVRLLREARAAARLRSEHVVRVLDVDSLPSGEPFVVMERLVGRDLAAVLRSEGPLPPERAVALLLQVCEAVAEAHALGIVHRDLKPSNLFLVAGPGGSERIKVLDFGISKNMIAPGEPHLTDSLTVVGSPRYMAPEQIRDARKVDGRADLWSLGVVLFEMLSGRLPFEAPTSAGLLIAIATDEPAPLPEGVPPALAAIVARCLKKSSERRWPSVLALAEALAPFAPAVADASLASIRTVEQCSDRVVAESSAPAEMTATQEPMPPSPSTVTAPGAEVTAARPRWMRTAALLGLLGAGFAAVLLTQGRSPTAATATPRATEQATSTTITQESPPAPEPPSSATAAPSAAPRPSSSIALQTAEPSTAPPRATARATRLLARSELAGSPSVSREQPPETPVPPAPTAPPAQKQEHDRTW